MEEYFGSEPPDADGWTSAGPGVWTRSARRSKKAKPKFKDGPRIAVVGGGPGGLFATYILNQRMPDANVTIFEASDCIGGKICTDEFSDGTPFESGVAELYEYLGSDGKDPMRTLIEEDLGLETIDISGGAVILKDEVLRDLDEVEKSYGYDTRKRIEVFHRKMVDLMPLEKYAHRWQPDNDHPWADNTFRDALMEEVGEVDPDALDYIETAIHTDLATESHTCNGLNGIKNALMDNDEYMQLYHVVGGIGRIPEALLEKIDAEVKTSTRVTKITSNDGKRNKSKNDYRVFTLDIGEETLAERFEDFDAVVVALPNHWLRTIKWEGQLAQAIHGVCSHYDLPAHYLRVSMLFDTKWWAELKIPGEFWMMDMFNGCCCYDDSTRWTRHIKSSKVKIDEDLWNEIVKVLPTEKPDELPHLVGTIDNEIRVIIVDGDKVKKEKSMDFVEGGNGLEDPDLCAVDEIYIDGRIEPEDWPYICYHEAVERRDMADNGTTYDKAHKKANAAEKILRMRNMAGGHVLSFLLAGGDALLMCSSNQDDECIVDHVLQSLPTFMREEAENHIVEAKVDRYVGAINAQPGGWPAEELRGEHSPEPQGHPGVFLVGDYFFDSTLNAALMSANTAVELLVEFFGKKSAEVTEAVAQLEADGPTI
jgi:hypothetical protein